VKGYAGTGKSSIAKAILNGLQAQETEHFVTAPTGRATKIISQKTGCYGRTMHSQIYKVDSENDSEHIVLKYRNNDNEDYSVFLVDEASMVSDAVDRSDDFQTPGALLADFIRYVKQGNNLNKVIFVGDDFQLPPVDRTKCYNYSPALSEKHIITKYGLTGSSYQLEEVKRQQDGSEVLSIATNIREASAFTSYHDFGIPLFSKNRYGKGSTNALHNYMQDFDESKLDKQVVVCYTNKDVSYWNKSIRQKLGLGQQDVAIGDFVTLQRSYISSSDTILKGEIAKVVAVESQSEERYGERFRKVTLEMADIDGGMKHVTARTLISSLYTDSGLLLRSEETAMMAEAFKYNAEYRASKNIMDDKYLGAMRLRHAYAITCNKAQGGEWDKVFVHNYYPKDDAQRWLYTAVTRARNEVVSWAA
jgi:exodeoxyribonuclease-5